MKTTIKVFGMLILALVFSLNLFAQKSGKDATVGDIPTDYKELRLNEGEKWVIDAEMMDHIRTGEKIFNHHLKSGSRDFAGLASQLTQANETLIISCSMTGEAHNQLHLWLHPHLNLVQKLKKSDSNRESLELIRQLQFSFEVFNNYFQ